MEAEEEGAVAMEVGVEDVVGFNDDSLDTSTPHISLDTLDSRPRPRFPRFDPGLRFERERMVSSIRSTRASRI